MRIRVALGALFTLLVLAGCSGSDGGSSGGAVAGSVADGGGAAYAPANAPAESARSAADSGKASGGSAHTVSVVDTRSLIRTAEIRVAVKAGTAAQQADRAEDITFEAGGEVYSDDRGNGYASLTLKVPPDQLSSVLSKLSALGEEKSRQSSTQDVTGDVADVNSRVDSARESIARLRTLYSTATKVSDVIAIEQELATRQADLESLEAQQRALEAQTAQATIRLSLTAVKVAAPAPKPKPDHHHGLGGAFASGWDAFTGAVAAVARGLAAALPFLVVVGLLGVAGRVAWRRYPRPVRTPAPAPDPS